MNYPQSERNAGNDIDPPDEPTTPPMRLILKSILASLPELTPAELYYLKGAVMDAQEERESRQVLAGQGIL
jgi:hypothetical protein